MDQASMDAVDSYAPPSSAKIPSFMRQFRLELDPSTSQESPPDDGDEAARILQGLNPVQRKAVVATDGPVLIIAGPGSGKTRTLTHRIAYLIAAGKARPFEVLALTFTNKAAREMKARIEAIVGNDQARGMWMGTFHSLFARLLRIEGEHIGFSRDFTIYDTDDSERLIRAQMERFNIDPKQFTPRSLRHLISSAKNQLVDPARYQQMAASLAQEKAALVYGPYEDALRRSNAMDFDDLLIRPIELFDKKPDVLEKYQQRWRYIHIDEYQDTNRAQYQLARRLASAHKNICVVGDDAQSIYAFRGADIGNILSFQRDYPEATTIRLEQNYRSTQRILRLADSIIKHNRDQLEKSLWTENKEGDHVVVVEALSEKDEAQKVERYVRDMRTRFGFPYRDFAVLYRTNAQSRSIEDVFRRAGIPYRLVGGVAFYQRKEIKDVLAYLRLMVNLNDEVSLRRIINYPTRGIGGKTEGQLVQFARENGISVWQAIERIEEVGLSGRAKNAIEQFRFLISKHAARIGSAPAEEITKELVREAGLLEDLRKENTPEGLMRWENVQELISAVAEHSASSGDPSTALSTFLQEVSLITDADVQDDNENKVTLMTLHASKGLEFPVVFICGLEEGLFPMARALQEPAELEEERRLFYVGATRAKEMLFLTHARSRFRYGQHESAISSRFLDEVDPEVVRTETGGRLDKKEERFTLSSGPSFSYKNADPHYYRREIQSSKKPAAPSGRRIVYEEGEGEIVPGARVEHEQFGEGKVIALDGHGDQKRAVVFFEDVGQKKLALKYARIRRIG
jgi:DNA helicase II / ATP-dependent DNA helicase PcrA